MSSLLTFLNSWLTFFNGTQLHFRPIDLKIVPLKNSQYEYSGDLKSHYARILNGQKEGGFQMAEILNGIWNPEPNHLKSRQIPAISSKPILNLDKIINVNNDPNKQWFSKYLDLLNKISKLPYLH